MRRAFILTVVLASSACAMTPQSGTYATELAALEKECDARQGILSRTSSIQGARPAEDYACVVRGGPSDRIRQSGD